MNPVSQKIAMPRSTTRDAIGRLADGCEVIGNDFRYLYVNDPKLRGRTMMECFPGIERTEMFAALGRCITEGKRQRLERELVQPDGQARWLEVHYVPVPDGVCVLSLDITEQKRMAGQLARTRDQLRASLQHEAVARVAGGIAHDINNVLSIILSLSEFIREELTPEATARADVDEIRTAGMRAADLTRQLLAFGTQPMMIARSVDLGALVATSEKSLKRILGTSIEVTRVSSKRCWPVSADPGQLEHVLLRLAMHARHAMPVGGKLTIETKNVELPSGPHVVLSFNNTCFTVDADNHSELVAAIHEIVAQSGGVIQHEVLAGEGSSLRICLPRAPDSAEHHPVTVPPFSIPTTGAIVVVEDDVQINGLISDILRRAGYRVLSAINAGEALLLCEQEVGRIDLLLTNVVLAHVNGQRLAQRLRPLHPEMRVVYMAGYTDDETLVHDVRSSGVPLLEKPITPADLLKQVRRGLGPVFLGARADAGADDRATQRMPLPFERTT